MKTLVTGAGGFIGVHITRQLLTAGESVRGLDVAWPGDFPPGAERVTGSILQDDALRAAMAGVDYVIHCAALAQLWVADRGAHDRVNSEGTVRVLQAAREAGAGLVHVSSYTTLIGRDARPGEVLDESAVLPVEAMLGPYPASKRKAELAVEAAAAAGQPASMVLPAAPVGAGDYNLTPPTAMIRDLARGRVPALLNCLLNLVDVQAVAGAAIAARSRGIYGERYVLAGEDITLPELAGQIADRSGVKAPKTRVPLAVALAAARVEAVISGLTGRAPTAPLTGVRLAARPVRFDTTKAQDNLGFAPRPLAVCLDEALAWIDAYGTGSS